MKRTGERGLRGGRGEEGEGSKGERPCGRERDKKEKKRERDSGRCQTSISYPFQVNPGIVFWSLRTVGWRK